MQEITNIDCPFCEASGTAKLVGYGDYSVYSCNNCGEYLDEADTAPTREKIHHKLRPSD